MYNDNADVEDVQNSSLKTGTKKAITIISKILLFSLQYLYDCLKKLI